MKSATAPQRRTPRPTRTFAMRFTSTPRGARLARRLVSHRLDAWGHPYASPANETVTLIAAELTANAARHGHVPGRDFHLSLIEAEDGILRVEVTDTRAERRPVAGPPAQTPAPDGESGRGLLLVDALADDWGVLPRPTGPGKTVWAEYVLPRGRTGHRSPPEN
ncbi:ATP-binding protein [Streptomyces sp. MAR25Y5]|uniref:ATP-binding protein n=1 Tax=Streptomyces sp. MAR25Y5 TaxID=2962028 RepID=UPI0020B7BFC9|nr:ATP-binding protein [Streptomyces sp. MAR25Y5]MCP3766049.1 ATP-binding protein [Streptomyces sp. MAR25Y5]